MTVRQPHLGVLSLVASAALLVGCVNTGGGTDDSASGTDGSIEGAVTWWGWNAFEYEQTIAEFEAEYPGVTVEFKQYSFDDYVTAIRTGLASGEGPDVFQVQPGELVENFGPLALPLEDFLAESHGDDWAEMINEQGLAQLQLDGEQVAMPSYMSAAGRLSYNASMLEELDVEVPNDFAEWEEACTTITDAGYDCLVHGANDGWVNLDVYLSIINSIAPGVVYEAIEGERAWTEPEFVEAMESWAELFSNGIIADGALAMAEYPDAFSTYLAGDAAFIALGTFNTPGTMTSTGIAQSQETVTETIDSVFLTAPFPAPQTGGEPTAAFGGPDNGWAVADNSDNEAAALAFLDFLAIGGGQEIQASGGNIPSVTDIPVATDDVVDERQVADIERQQEAMNNLIGARQIPYAELSNALADALSSVAAGSQTAEDALAQVESVSGALTR